MSRRDGHDLDADVAMFFVLGNALFDASIAVWDAKVVYDYVRPVSALRFVFAGQVIEVWAGPFQGTQSIPAEQFQSYLATPPFAEYTSGHSAFSAAGATVLASSPAERSLAPASCCRGELTIEPGVTRPRT